MENYLKSLIPDEQLREIAEAIASCTDLAVRIIDSQGEILAMSGIKYNYCTAFAKAAPGSFQCASEHLKAAKTAAGLKAPYLFTCRSNMSHLAFPFLFEEKDRREVIVKKLCGAVILGPFLTEEADDLMIMDLARRHHLPLDKLLDLKKYAEDIPVISAEKISRIGVLLSYCFQSSTRYQNLELAAGKAHPLRQSRVKSGEKIQKNAPSLPTYPVEKEQSLIHSLQAGDAAACKKALHSFLNYVLIPGDEDLANAKIRAVELTSLLSRSAIDGGAATDSILRINNKFLMELSTLKSPEDLENRLQEIVKSFCSFMFPSVPGKNAELVKKAFSYISANFANPISLEDVAAHVGLNPSYFSTVFKQSSGSSFKEYLNMVRIEESKRLLTTTDYSLIDIAAAVGFEDQSYFSKVFKKYTGLTPRQYR